MGLLVGVTVSTLAIGTTLNLMNKGLEKYVETQIPVNIQSLPVGVKVEREAFTYHGKNYELLNSLGSHEIPDGEYLYDPGTKAIEYQWAQGIGSAKAPAPQARLMATVISGILNQRLPWRLVLMGVALVIAVEILGVRSLAFATGSYLPLGTTAAMFAGGLVRMLVDATTKKKDESSLLQWPHRRRRSLRPPRHRHQSLPGSRSWLARPELVRLDSPPPLESRHHRLRPPPLRLLGHQQRLRPHHVHPLVHLPLLLRPQETRLAQSRFLCARIITEVMYGRSTAAPQDRTT
jgi:hypothetical protein